jgi:hypothetical protein
MNSEESIKVKSKNYDYMRIYVEKHKGEKKKCTGCDKYYLIFNKSHHMKSKYHKETIEMLKNKLVIEELENKIEELKK